MGIIAKDDRQLTLIYSSNTSIGAKVNAYAQAANDKLLAIDISKTKLSDSQWAEIVSELNITFKDLVSHKEDKDASFTDDDWLKILQSDDRLLAKPVAINGDRIKQLESYTSILDFMGVDSAGIEKTMHTEPPNISGSDGAS